MHVDKIESLSSRIIYVVGGTLPNYQYAALTYLTLQVYISGNIIRLECLLMLHILGSQVNHFAHNNVAIMSSITVLVFLHVNKFIYTCSCKLYNHSVGWSELTNNVH